MSQIQVVKLPSNVMVATPTGHEGVAKLVMYVLAFPGDEDGSGDASNRQGRVHCQILRRS